MVHLRHQKMEPVICIFIISAVHDMTRWHLQVGWLPHVKRQGSSWPPPEVLTPFPRAPILSTYSPMSRDSNSTTSPRSQSPTHGETALLEIAHNSLSTPELLEHWLCSEGLLPAVQRLTPEDQTIFIDKVDRVR